MNRTILESARRWSRAQQMADYFGLQAFLRLVVITGLFAWLWIGYNLQLNLIGRAVGLMLMLVVVIAAGMVVWLHQRHYLEAVAIYLAAQLFFISFLMGHANSLDLGFVFVLTIVSGGALAGPLGAFGAAMAAIGAEIALVLGWPELAGSSSLLAGLVFLQLLTALIASQAAMGMYDALESAEASARHASHSAEEARRHRGQLQRTLKSLDITHRQLQRANAELYEARNLADQALRFKAMFAAKVSHELRTSLNLILGFSETMAFAQESYGKKLPAPYLRDVTEIYRNSRHLLALVDDILDLSKLEAGRMGLRLEPVSLPEVLHESLDMVRPLIETKGLALRAEISPGLPGLALDRVRISQVLLNLLSNATRITTQGSITVRATATVEEVTVQVRDTGPGIKPDDLQRVFEEFRQLDNSGGVSSTTGLGLTVSQQIIELHGGKLWVDSVYGEGSTFSFLLPVSGVIEAPHYSRATPIGPSRKPQPALVVLAEADSDEVKLLQRHLEGYELAVAQTWEEVQRLVVQASARAVIVNEAYTAAAETPALPVPLIYCPLPGPKQSQQNLQVEHYLQKPITTKALLAALAKFAPQAHSLLIVDDNPSAVRMLEQMVKSGEQPYQVGRAYSGRDALARIQTQPPDALILDLVMPDGDGYWLISALRENPATAKVPIIVASGQAVEETWESGAIAITSEVGFSPTETLNYLQGLASVIPPTRVERHATAPA
jgi:signal transduction histidine kinase